MTNLAVPAEYQGLYRYLEHRFAETVVLTFAQIEDLLGFELPELARRGREWWTTTDTSSMQCRAWTNAHRTAVPNLTAQTVTFERA